jgi:hypothetical protein
MLNPFKKKKFHVPVDDCFNAILDAIRRDEMFNNVSDVWSWLEGQGVKRKWNWTTHRNYLIFDSEHDYMLFLLKL